MYIDDCVDGTRAIMDSDILEPINLGTAELVTINQLVDIVEEIAGVKLKRSYNLSRAQGRERPQQRQHDDQASTSAGSRRISLEDGLEKTYAWIYDRLRARYPTPQPISATPSRT